MRFIGRKRTFKPDKRLRNGLFFLLFLIVTGGVFYFTTLKSAAAWYNSSWSYRKEITISHTMVANTDQSNFPVLIKVTDASLKYTGSGGHVGKSDGSDILFTASDQTTLLNYEIEHYVSTTGELEAWVKIPTLSHTTDTNIYMYYGNASASGNTSSNIHSTWSNSYDQVWHLSEGTGTTTSDSTSNANSGTLQNSPTWATSGQISGGVTFDATSSQDISTGTTGLPTGSAARTMCAWVNNGDVTNDGAISSYGTASNDEISELLVTASDGHLQFVDWVGDVESTLVPSTGWNYECYTYTASSTSVVVWLNGTSQTLSLSDGNPLNTTLGAAYIGRRNSSGYPAYFTGSLDEIQISSGVRSSDWINTSYNNQESPSTYETFGSESINAPTAPVFYNNDGGLSQIAYDDIRLHSTNPVFRVSSTFSSSINDFQVEVNTASDFTGTVYTQTFSGTYTSGSQYNLVFTTTLPTTDGVTYYVRARASADGGTTWGSWSSGTRTFTYTSSSTNPDWYQSTDTQFNEGTLSNAQTTGSGSVDLKNSSISEVAEWDNAGTISTLSISPSAVGDLIMFAGAVYSSSIYINGVSGGGVTTWHSIDSYNASDGVQGVLYYGVVTTTGSSSISVTYSGSNPGSELVAQEYSAASGSSTAWSVDTHGTLQNSSSTTVTFPSLTSTGSSELYWGYASIAYGGIKGSTSGFTYQLTNVGTNIMAYDNNTSASTTYQPTASQTSAGTSDAIAAIMVASPSSGTIMSPPIDYSSAKAATTWNTFDWTDTVTHGSVSVQLYYTSSTACDTIVPDAALSGNSSGFTSGPVDISGLSTSTYSELCLKATLTNSGGTPYLDDWALGWFYGPTTAQRLRGGEYFSGGSKQPFYTNN